MQTRPMQIICLDLEGVLIPEIWIEFAERTGVPELSRTTRDEPDYDRLMRERIAILKHHRFGLLDIQKVIGEMAPLPGARAFLDQLRERFQVVILSDTFYEFVVPLMRQLNFPTIFCHQILANNEGDVIGYRLRMQDQKRGAIASFRALNFKTIAVGDSYNDVTMLKEADAGIFFRPPEKVVAEFPTFPVAREYTELNARILAASANIECFATVKPSVEGLKV